MTYLVPAIITLLLLPVPLFGEQLRIVPGLAVKEEFNDNIYLSTASHRTDFISTVTPSLDLSSATERGSGTLSTGVGLLYYYRNSSLNSEDYYVQGGFNYRFEPRLSVSAGAGYVQDSRSDRIDSSTDLTIKSGSERQNYQAALTYAVSEKSGSTLSYAYSREIFDNPDSLSTRIHTATVAQDYDLDQYLTKGKLLGSFGYSRDLTDVSTVDTFTATIGISKKTHELWGCSLNAGGRYTRSEFDVSAPATSTDSNHETGWIGNASLNYSDETTTGSLSFKHDIASASGYTGTTERTGISTALTERFTRELSGFMVLGYSWNRSSTNQDSAQAIDENNLTVKGGVRYDLNEYLSLEGNYGHNTIYYNRTSSRASQNTFILMLTMRRDLMEL